MRRALACAIGAGLAGCSLFVSLDDLDRGGSGSPDGGSSADAPSSDGSSSDAAPLSAYAAAVLADSPIAFYRLDDTDSTARDIGPSHLDGTYGPGIGHAPGLLNGDPDTCATFPGSPDGGSAPGVIVPQSVALEPRNGITIEAWVRFSAVRGEIASYGSDPSAPFQPWVMQIDSNGSGFGPLLELYAANLGEAFGNTQLTAGPAFHLATTYDGTMMLVYVNGAIDGDGGTPGVLGNYVMGGLGIGSNANGSEPVSGEIDEVAIYDHALTADRIRAHYLAGTQ